MNSLWWQDLSVHLDRCEDAGQDTTLGRAYVLLLRGPARTLRLERAVYDHGDGDGYGDGGGYGDGDGGGYGGCGYGDGGFGDGDGDGYGGYGGGGDGD